MWIRCSVLILLSSCALLAQEPAPETTSLAELQRKLKTLVTHERFAAASWGVKVVSVKTGKTCFEHDAHKLLSPASNTKLFTVALALDRLGPGYRIPTSLYAGHTPGPDGTLAGDLIVYGRGDPLPASRPDRTNLCETLLPLIQALTNAGVKSITGDLVADASFFQGAELGAGWVWDDSQNYYGAEISALTIHDNLVVVTVTPGEIPGLPCRVEMQPPCNPLVINNHTRTVECADASEILFHREVGQNVLHLSGVMPIGASALTNEVPVRKPALLYGHLLRLALERHGIRVSGGVKAVDWLDSLAAPTDPRALIELGRVESPPLREIVREIQKPSHNLFADLLFAHVGEISRTPADAGSTSEELAARELSRFLERSGMRPSSVYVEEGSGLSRNNLVSASAIVDLLLYMAEHPAAGVFYNSLPVAGVDGTLRKRFQGTTAQANLRAKTGTLRWASSLSGYVDTNAGERLAFSLMLNRYRPAPAAPSTREELDSIAGMLAELSDVTAE